MLYFVPTPIGNLDDMTYRAIKVLKRVKYILSEDTRVTRRLLEHYQLNSTLYSFHAHNEHRKLDKVLEDLIAGIDVALVSDAGTPGISDPGYLLAHACREKNIDFTCLPGATAFVPALVMSGLPTDEFLFVGFLPHKKGRQKKWISLLECNSTIVLYESTHRIIKCMEEIAQYFGKNTLVAIGREISKLHEEVVRMPVQDLIEYFLQNPVKTKGEFVVIIDSKD